MISMEENKNQIENTNIEKAKMFLSSSPEQRDNKSHEDYIKDFKDIYKLNNPQLNTSTKVLLFKPTMYEFDENGNGKYTGRKDLKGLDHQGKERYYTQINALYATTVDQIKLFEDIRHYYFTTMSKNILKDNFDKEINVKDENEYDNIFKEEILENKNKLKNKEDELNKYRLSKLNNNNDYDKIKDELSKLNIKDLRKNFEILIAQNLKNINKNKVSKYYKVAYTARSPKIIDTYIELQNSIKDVKKEINDNNKKKNLKAKVKKNKNEELDDKELDILENIEDIKGWIKHYEKLSEEYIDKNYKFKSMNFVLDLLCLDKIFYESIQNQRDYIELVICVSDNNTKKLKLGKNVELDPEEFKKNNYTDDLFDMDNNNSDNNVAIYSKYVEYEINQDAKSFKELFMKKKIDYVQKFQKFNSCFLNCIINDYKKAFDITKSDGKRMYKELTYEYLMSLLDVETNKEDNIGISVNRAYDNFYSKFKLGLDILDESGILIYSKRPKCDLNSHIRPQVHRLILTNNHHIESCNENLNNFRKHKTLLDLTKENRDIKKMYEELLNLKVSTNYPIPKNENKDKKEYKVSENIKEIEDNENTEETEDTEDTETKELIETKNTVIINNIEDIKKVILCYIDQDKRRSYNIRCIYNGNLDNLLHELYFEGGYIPGVSFFHNKVKSIRIKLIKINLFISRADVYQGNNGEIVIDKAIVYDKYTEAFEELFKTICSKNILSHYHENSLKIDNYYSKRAIGGYFKNDNEKLLFNKSYDAIDIRKCYTAMLYKISVVPKFDYFDVYKKYDGHEIEEYNMYIIECKTFDNISKMLFPNKRERVYGVKLSNLPKNIEYDIIYYRRPSSLIEVDFKTPIEELYKKDFSSNNEEIELKIKKYIVNVLSGLLEKKYNYKSNTHIFVDYKKALSYANLFGGKVRTVLKIDYINDEIEVINNNDEDTKKPKINTGNLLDMGTDNFDENEYNEYMDLRDKYNSNIIINRKNEDKNYEKYRYIDGMKIDKNELYIVSIEKDKLINNSFRPIKDLIYDLSHLEIVKIYNKMIENNITPLGVRTDCVLFEPIENIDKIFNFENVIGGYKLEHEKELISTRIDRYDNELLDILNLEPEINEIKDEFDNKEFKEIFDNSNHTIVKATLPGCGKTTSIKNYDNKTLFICPFNKQCQENMIEGINSITFNKLIGKSAIENDDEKKYKKLFDVSIYKNICFDELYLYTPEELKLIDKFIINNNDKKYMSTGDPDQIIPFGYKPNNIDNVAQYINDCVNIMYPTQINLKINKRLTNQADRDILDNLKLDIFNRKLDIIDVFKKYNFNLIYNMNDVKTTKNICYFNGRSDSINYHVHKNIVKIPKGVKVYNHKIIKNKREEVLKYYEGLELICRKHMIINNEIKDINKSKKESKCEKVDKSKKEITSLEYYNYMQKLDEKNKKINEFNDEINKNIDNKAYVKLIKQDIKVIEKNIKIINKIIENSIVKENDNNLFDEDGNMLCDSIRLFVNYTYTILSIHDDHMYLLEPVEKLKFKIFFNQLNIFNLPYAGTCHSYQSLSIKDDITIFDTNICYTNRNWVWTAITRARDLKKVNIFVHSESSKLNLVESKIKQYFKFKIEGYIQQDKKTKRYNPENYIDIEWFLNRLDMNFKDCPTFNSYCPDCHKAFEFNFNENNDILSNISADRKDNNLGHNKSNIRLCCVKCNIKKGNR